MRNICKLLALTVLSTSLLQGCASSPTRQTTPSPPPQSSVPSPSIPEQRQPQPEIRPAVQAPERTANIAADFSRKADKQIAEGSFNLAAATLERGLGLAPKDAELWSKLAEVKLQQQQYQQARSLAAKSSSLAGGNEGIIRKNKQIISDAEQSGAGK